MNTKELVIEGGAIL